MRLNIYPNPYKVSTALTYKLQEPAKVRILLLNILGEKLKTINNQELPAGTHSHTISTPQAGVYYVTLEINGQQITRRLIDIQ